MATEEHISETLNKEGLETNVMRSSMIINYIMCYDHKPGQAVLHHIASAIPCKQYQGSGGGGG